MSYKSITKLKLQGGNEIKLFVLSAAAWEGGEADHAERYFQQIGTNLRYGTAAGALKTWTLDNERHTELHFQSTEVEQFIYQPSQFEPQTIDGIRRIHIDGNAGSGAFYGDIGSLWLRDFPVILPDGVFGLAIIVDEDEESNAGRFGYIVSNPPQIQEEHGAYTVYIPVITVPDMKTWLDGSYSDSTDPYDPNDGENKGGDGDKDGGSDDNPIPGLPTVGATDTGFVTLFNPTIAQLRSLANYMWSDTFDLNNFKKLFANPMDAILGLTMLPVNVPSVASGAVKIGNISTGVVMNYVSNQYMKVNCGSLNIKEFWGAYLDYSPMTKIEIYLPYIGTRSLSADDVMGKTIKVEYNVDVLTGACVAHILCGSSVLYEFAGQCGIQIPINGNNFDSMLTSAVSAAVAVGTAAVAIGTGGAATPVAAGAAISGAGAIANSVMSSKGEVQRSGSMGNSAGLLGHQKPYLIITRPRQCVASNQNKFEGYPSYQSKKLSSCRGYTQILQIHLENIPATDAEKLEIERLLMEGVII